MVLLTLFTSSIHFFLLFFSLFCLLFCILVLSHLSFSHRPSSLKHGSIKIRFPFLGLGDRCQGWISRSENSSVTKCKRSRHVLGWLFVLRHGWSVHDMCKHLHALCDHFTLMVPCYDLQTANRRHECCAPHPQRRHVVTWHRFLSLFSWLSLQPQVMTSKPPF